MTIIDCEKVSLELERSDRIRSQKVWDDMSDEEREVCVHGIITDSGTADELRTKLGCQLGLNAIMITWTDIDPELKAKLKAQIPDDEPSCPIYVNDATVTVFTREGDRFEYP